MDTRRGLSAVCLPRPLMMGEMESLCFALDLMMQGSGFTRCEKSDRESSDNQVKRYGYSAPLGPMVPVNVVCTRLGSQMIFHASMLLPGRQQSNIISFMFPICEYVQKKKTTDNSDAQGFLKNRVRLRQLFMDNIVHKLITDLRRALQLPETGTILCLSHEIKLKVMAFLNLESLLSLSEVNKEFYLLAQDPQLWQRLFKGRFSRGKSCDSQKSTWKELYISNYRESKEAELRNVPNKVPHFPPFYTDPILPTLPYLRSHYTFVDFMSNRGRTDREQKFLNPIHTWQFDDYNVFDT